MNHNSYLKKVNEDHHPYKKNLKRAGHQNKDAAGDKLRLWFAKARRVGEGEGRGW